MSSDDPDLEAFQSNLRAIIRAGELEQTALVFNLCPKAVPKATAVTKNTE